MLLISLQIVKLILILLAFLLLGVIGFIMISFRQKVPFVPTPRKLIRKMIELADIRPGEKICDLGSGSGRIIFLAAKLNPKNLVTGLEISPTLRLVSKFWLFWHPGLKKRIQIIKQDFFNADLYEFDVILCFLTPEALRLLSPKFQTLKPGSRIVSYMFSLEEHPNFDEVIDHISDSDSIYYYKKI